MHLISLTVRNYRVHDDVTVDFDRELNVIGGPNESGKTTLVEAAHRALFLRANVTGAARDAMISRPNRGHPEVELRFMADGEEWTLRKRYSGSNGTTALSRAGETSLSGDEAEARLAELLGGEEPLGGRQAGRVDGKWGHLWVWQGTSGKDPSAGVGDHAGQLMQRLQAMGGIGVYLSDRDHRVAKDFESRYEDLFTQAGKPRAGTDLTQREEARQHADDAVRACEEKVQELDAAVRLFHEAGRRKEDAEAALSDLQKEHEEVRGKLKEAERLQKERATQAESWEKARRERQKHEDADQTIRGLAEEIRELEASLEPRRTALQRLEEDLERRQRAREELDRKVEAASNALRERNRHAELARALATAVERKTTLNELEEKREQIEELQGKVEDVSGRLSELPSATEEVLDELRKAEAGRVRLEDQLNAIAAEVEVLEAGVQVRVGGEVLEVGGPRVLTEESELQVGDSTRIRIRPGGGENLEEVRRALQAATSDLSERLGELGCESLEGAREVHRGRSKLEVERSDLRSKLGALTDGGFDEKLRRAREELTEAEGALERLGEELPEDLPDLEELRERGRQAESLRQTREAEYNGLQEERANLDTELERGRDDREKQREALQSDENELTKRREKKETLEEGAGGEEARAAALRSMKDAEEEQASALASIDSALEALDPDRLAQDDERLERAIQKQTEEQASAQRDRTRAETLLESNGTFDPHAELKAARVTLDATRERETTARDRAHAIKLLHETFEAEKQRLAHDLAAPLEDRVNQYLGTVFADGSEIAMNMEGTTFGTPALRRDERFDFLELSGGAREQFAAAVRLAVAEVLAEEHDGSLPMLFDDAFAYSDPDRVRGLMRALDLGARQGLQILLLTCTPQDYAGLGAKVIRLDPAMTGASAPAGDEPAATAVSGGGAPRSDARPAAGTVATTADSPGEQFLSTLQTLGGRSGNMALQRELGWDDETYAAVRDDLVTSGLIEKGRGRGGSVMLVGDG